MADSIEKPAFESPKLSKEAFKEQRLLHIEFNSPKFKNKRDEIRNRMLTQRAQREAGEMQGKIDFYKMNGSDIGFDREVLNLSGHTVEEKDAFRHGMLGGFIDDPKHFQKFYDDNLKNLSDQEKSSKDNTHTALLYRGISFLNNLNDDVIAVYVQKFQEENPSAPKDLQKQVFDYVHQIDPKVFEKLLHYDQSDEASKVMLYQNFKANCGLNNLPEDNVKVLFEDVVKSLQTQAFEAQRYFSSYHAMLNKIEDAKGQGISDEEWEQMLEEEQAKADKENQSAANENQGFPLNLAFQEVDPAPKPMVSAVDAAKYIGAERIESYNPDNGHYDLVLPGSVHVEMLIDTTGASGFSDAHYVLYDKNSDNHGSVTVTQKDLRASGNRIRLDALATGVLIKRMPQFHQVYNDALTDEQMMSLGSKLFGRSLDTASLNEKDIHLFEKFMNILVNPDVNPTFYGPATDDFGKRVAKALIVLSSKDTVGKIQNALNDETLAFVSEHLSSVNFTEFLKQIGYRDPNL